MSDDDPLGKLPPTFTYGQARDVGVTKWRLYALRDSGVIEAIARGVYQRADDRSATSDHDLLEIAHRAHDATLCLTTALIHHGLSDAIPSAIDVALPRGAHRPQVASRVNWHMFDPGTFDIGRERLAVDSHTGIGLYSVERCIIDAFRLRHHEGEDVAHIALRRWLARRSSSPAVLLQMARRFPQAQKGLRQALEILLYE
ncbi:MAG: type IV toxin-antitoxin system AbiEi family antitoxin domain-containing protein [Micromonosporaceae bacterium]